MRKLTLAVLVVSGLVAIPLILGASAPQPAQAMGRPPLLVGQRYEFNFGTTSTTGDVLERASDDWVLVGWLVDGKNVGDETWVNLRAVNTIRKSKLRIEVPKAAGAAPKDGAK